MAELAELVLEAGGADVVADILRVSVADVRTWILADSIPERYYLPLWKIAVVYHIEWVPPGCEWFVLRNKFLEQAGVSRDCVQSRASNGPGTNPLRAILGH